MPLTSIVSGEKLAINCTVIPVFYELFFLSCYFQYFLLVFSSSSLTKLCLYMDLFMFILLEICWLSWFCRVMFLSIVWCFQPLFIQIIFLPFYWTLISHFLVHLILSYRTLLIFLYSFFLSVLHFSLIYLQGKFTDLLLNPSSDFFHFSYCTF